MTLATLDIFVIIAYFLATALVVYAVRAASTFSDFAVGTRTTPALVIMATLSATYIGPGYSMGLANDAAVSGYVWLFIFMAFSLQTILVGIFVAPRLRAFTGAYTIGDVMGARYGKAAKLITGILSVVLCAAFIGAITRASGEIINTLTGIPFLWAAAISLIIVIGYSSIGGIKAVVITDVLQFIILALVIPGVIVMLALKSGGLGELIEIIPASSFEISQQFPPIVFLGLFMAFLLGEALIPPYANRALIAGTPANARNGFVLAGLFSVVWFFVCATIGVFGGAMGITEDGGSPFMAVLAYAMPAGVLGLATAALISIIMSSQSSLLHSATLALTNDILGVFDLNEQHSQRLLLLNRSLLVVIGLIGLYIALVSPSIVAALLICYTIWAPTVVLPLVIALLKKEVKPLSAITGILGGGIATLVWLWGFDKPWDIPEVLVGIAVNQILFWGVELSRFSGLSSNAWLSPMNLTEK